jgi:hypothetical protein
VVNEDMIPSVAHSRFVRRLVALLSVSVLLAALTVTFSLSAAATVVYASDSFNRTVTNGWGNADIGGAWTGTGSNFAVTPGSGTITADSTTPSTFLTTSPIQDVDLEAKFTPPAISANYVDAGIAVRYASGGTFYQLSTYYASSNNSGNLTVELKRKPDNTPINPDFNTSLAPGTFWLRLEAQGINPTTLRWKIWMAGTAEPSSWTGSATDGTAAMQAAGGVGAQAYVNSGTTTMAVNSFTASSIATPAPALTCSSSVVACDSFSRTVSGGWGSADVGGAWSGNGAAYSVTPGAAAIQADSTAPSTFLSAISVQGVDAEVKVSPPAITSAYVDTGLAVRYSASGNSFYQLSVYYATGNNSGNYTVELKSQPSNNSISADFPTSLAGGSAIWLRLQAQGANPTTLRWKIWQDGAPEPAAWNATASDSTAAMQAPGAIGLKAYTSSGTSTVLFNGLSANPLVTSSLSSCPSGVVACDTYNRTVTAGWGSADVGGAWSTSGPAYAVSPGNGSVLVDATTPTNFLAGVSVGDVDAEAKLLPPGTSTIYVDGGIGVRYQASGGNFYQLSAYYATGNNGSNYTIELKRKPENVALMADVNTAIPGGTPLWLRLQAQGTNPTSLRWKAWADGVAEPSTWMGTATDATAALQAAGGVGVEAYASSGTASLGFNVLWAAALTPSPPPPPPSGFTCAASSLACDTYARTASGGWGTADVGGSWSILDTPSAWSVSPGSGSVSEAAGASARGYLSAVSARDVEVLTQVVLPMSTQSTCDAFVLGRFTAGSSPTYFRVGVVQGPSNPFVTIRAQRGDGSYLSTDVSTGIPASAGIKLWLRVQFQGASPTSIRAHAWQDGTAEPSFWMFSTTDSTPSLQRAGAVGVRVRNEDSAQTHVFQYEAFQAVPMPAVAPLPTGFATDAFNRNVSGGWGAAPIGGSWSTSSNAYAVSPGRATVLANSSTRTNFLNATAVQDVDARVWLSPPGITSTYVDEGLAVRYVAAGGTFYQLSAYYSTGNNNGNYTVQLKRKPANTVINPDFNTTIPGGTAIWLRLQAQGVNPTTLNWKIWQDGTPEPSAWTGSGVDSTTAMQTAGGVGVEAFSNTGTPTAAFNGFTAAKLGP